MSSYKYLAEVYMSPVSCKNGSKLCYRGRLWREDKKTGIRAALHTIWSDNPEDAWKGIKKEYESLHNSDTMHHVVYQPMYILEDGTAYAGNLYTSSFAALENAMKTGIVNVNGEFSRVCGVSIETRSLITDNFLSL